MGTIFDIQRFSTHDGPGIRTTVFLKGCPLRCAWCHNPESQSSRVDVRFTPELCIDCHACEEACPLDSPRELLAARADNGPVGQWSLDGKTCRRCYAAAGACPTGAIERVGREATCQEIMAEVESDRVFYEQSGGGMTISGGEPLAQAAFTRELLEAARAAGVHTCLETCGFGRPEDLDNLAPLVDLFLWDLKDTDPVRHQSMTGGGLNVSLENLARVDALGRPIILRCLMIEGHNLTPEHLAGIAQVAAGLTHLEGIELIPYHPMGEGKLAPLGRVAPETPPFAVPSPERLHAARQWLADQGLPVLSLST